MQSIRERGETCRAQILFKSVLTTVHEAWTEGFEKQTSVIKC